VGIGNPRTVADLQVMTFNIRGLQRRDSDNAWKWGASLNVSLIKRYAPDLIGF
jgi:hypothetical protein